MTGRHDRESAGPAVTESDDADRPRCMRCDTELAGTTPRTAVSVIFLNDHTGEREVLAELYLCGDCGRLAQDSLSLETSQQHDA